MTWTSSDSVLGDAPTGALVRYGELALKGTNRQRFERALVRNLRFAVKPLSPVQIERRGGRIWILPEERAAAVARRACQVFGVKSVSPVWRLPADCAEPTLMSAAQQVFERAADELPRSEGRAPTFRVRTKRADKSFPRKSEETDRWIGSHLARAFPEFQVNLSEPDLELELDLRLEGRYLFVERHAGPGGLPVGSLGRALCLLSGGIDSPVAAWKAMKRGLEVGYLNFHSGSYVGEGALKKVRDLVQALSPWQPTSRLFIAPFDELQERIRSEAPERYRTVLFRRAMTRVAEGLAQRLEFGALVTGDSLGQVASQTLENLACLEAGTTLPVLRPLVGHDKEETIAEARRLGTLDISLRNHPDCCTVFQPKRPALRARAYDCERIEAELGLQDPIERCLANIEVWKAKEAWA